MKEFEIETFLTSDFIYIPYLSKENINLKNDGYVFKNDMISENYYSPVSGKAIGLTEIYGIGGVKKTVIIENDFRDKIEKKKICIEDLYSLDKEIIKNIVNKYVDNNSLNVYIKYEDKYDLRDMSILKDNVSMILETLNIIDSAYDNLEVKIILNKKDLASYQVLFTYIGTYPNIRIEFNKKSDNTINLHQVIDIYNELKNKNKRDFVYVTLIHENKFKVIKLKKYSNLKDLLEHTQVMSNNFTINSTIKIQNANFLLDDSVSTIKIEI